MSGEDLLGSTRRSRMRAAFAGIVQEVPPVSIRMDLWYQDAVSRGVLPGDLSGSSVEGIEDRLGFCRCRSLPNAPLPGLSRGMGRTQRYGRRETYTLPPARRSLGEGGDYHR